MLRISRPFLTQSPLKTQRSSSCMGFFYRHLTPQGASQHQSNPNRFVRYVKGTLLSSVRNQKAQHLMFKVLGQNTKCWEALFDRALESRNIAVLLELLDVRSFNHFPDRDPRIAKFWELYIQESQNSETVKQWMLKDFLNTNSSDCVRRPTKGIPSKVIAQMIHDLKENENALHSLYRELRMMLSDQSILNSMSREEQFKMLQIFSENQLRRSPVWELNRELILNFWDQLFNEAVRSDKIKFHVLLDLCEIKPFNEASSSQIIRFWERCLREATNSESDQVLVDALNVGAPILDSKIARRITSRIFENINRAKNPSDSDVLFEDDAAWDSGFVNPAARNRLIAKNLRDPLVSLVKVLCSLNDRLKLDKNEEDQSLFDECLSQIEHCMPFARQHLEQMRLKELNIDIFEKIQRLLNQKKPRYPAEQKVEEQPHEVLGLSLEESRDPKKIAAAYRRHALENHPDLQGPESKTKMQKINDARATLLAALTS